MGQFSVRPALVTVLLVSMTIAAIAPYDVVFAAATFGSPLLRVACIAALALTGAFCANRMGLRLEGHGTQWPVLVGVAAAFVVAVWVATIDGLLFRSLLTPSYVNFLQRPLGIRFVYFMPRAFNENVIYRLFVFSGLLYILSVFKGARSITTADVAAGMFLAQFINIGLNVVAPLHDQIGVAVLCYDLLRYVVPGVIWAWLFWRFGFITAEIASVGCHIFLQPAFSYFF